MKGCAIEWNRYFWRKPKKCWKKGKKKEKEKINFMRKLIWLQNIDSFNWLLFITFYFLIFFVSMFIFSLFLFNFMMNCLMNLLIFLFLHIENQHFFVKINLFLLIWMTSSFSTISSNPFISWIYRIIYFFNNFTSQHFFKFISLRIISSKWFFSRSKRFWRFLWKDKNKKSKREKRSRDMQFLNFENWMHSFQ